MSLNASADAQIATALTELGLIYTYTPPHFSLRFATPSGAEVELGVASFGTVVSVLNVVGVLPGGSASMSQAFELLRLNLELGLAKIGIGDQSLFVNAQIPLHNLDAPAMESAIGAVLQGVDRVRHVLSQPLLSGK